MNDWLDFKSWKKTIDQEDFGVPDQKSPYEVSPELTKILELYKQNEQLVLKKSLEKYVALSKVQQYERIVLSNINGF